MVKTSPITSRQPATAQTSPAIPWANLARATDLHHRHRTSGNFGDQGDAMQALMQELTKCNRGVKPEKPLPVTSRDGHRSWILEGWALPGFFVVEIASARMGSACEGWTTRYEFIPMVLR